MSCSNDGQILLWHIEEVTGEGIKANVINKFEDTDYVYSLSVLTTSKNSEGWVSSGENTGIKIFEKDGKVSSYLVPLSCASFFGNIGYVNEYTNVLNILVKANIECTCAVSVVCHGAS